MRPDSQAAASCAVLGTGAALPGKPITTAALVAAMAPHLSSGAAALAKRIAQRLAIETRHLSRALQSPVEGVSAEYSAPRLAASAIRQALAQRVTNVDQLDFLIGHTATPHTLLPSNTAWTADELRYSGPHAELRQACTGFAAALMLARGLLGTGSRLVAVVGSETGSVFLDPRHIADDPSQLVNLVQMGDGADGVVLGHHVDRSLSSIERPFYGSTGLGQVPGLSLNEGGSGAPWVAHRGVPHFSHRHSDIKVHGMALLARSLEAARAAGIDPAQINWFLPHQANGRMAEICATHLHLPRERVFCDAGAVGNLGSAAIWVALDRLRRSGRLAIGDRVLVLGAEATKYLYGGFLYVHGSS